MHNAMQQGQPINARDMHTQCKEQLGMHNAKDYIAYIMRSKISMLNVMKQYGILDAIYMA